MKKTLCAGSIVAAICTVAASHARAGEPASSLLTYAGQTPIVIIDQARIDAAMSRLQRRIDERRSNPPATQPAVIPAIAVAQSNTNDVGVFVAKKLAMVHEYDARIEAARIALRHGEAKPAEVRQLANEQAILQRLSIDRFADLLREADDLNNQRIARYRLAFGDLKTASGTVVTILMKAGLIDTATIMPDDPLTEEIELARGVRRVYYQFVLPAHDSSPIRHHNGYVEFQMASSVSARGLWLPIWADLEGSPIPLFDAEAFLPLQPYRVQFNGTEFTVLQDQPTQPPSALFSLLAPRQLLGTTSVVASKRFSPDE